MEMKEEKQQEVLKKQKPSKEKIGEKFTSSIVQYIRKGKKKRRNIGVLFAGVLKKEPENVVVGFSLCKEKFDKYNMAPLTDKKPQKMIHVPGLGLKMAQANAIRWKEKSFVFTSMSPDQPPFHAFVKVPKSILDLYKVFVGRVQRYYRDKKFPAWVEAKWEDKIKDCKCPEEDQPKECSFTVLESAEK
jgi:hypothetical protein